jgi:hypothetical protein
VDHLTGDGAVGQACGGPGQDEPGQRIGLERGQLVRTRRNSCLAQIPDNGKRHIAPPCPRNTRNINRRSDRLSEILKHLQSQKFARSGRNVQVR